MPVAAMLAFMVMLATAGLAMAQAVREFEVTPPLAPFSDWYVDGLPDPELFLVRGERYGACHAHALDALLHCTGVIMPI